MRVSVFVTYWLHIQSIGTAYQTWGYFIIKQSYETCKSVHCLFFLLCILKYYIHVCPYDKNEIKTLNYFI